MNICEMTLDLQRKLLALLGYYEDVEAVYQQLQVMPARAAGIVAFEDDEFLQEGWIMCYESYVDYGFSEQELHKAFMAVIEHIIRRPEYYDYNDEVVDEKC